MDWIKYKERKARLKIISDMELKALSASDLRIRFEADCVKLFGPDWERVLKTTPGTNQ